MRKGIKPVVMLTVVLAMVAVVALPAMGTVDEISGMSCSGGNAVFAPPGQMEDEIAGGCEAY